MACKCISYNQPHPSESEPSIALIVPEKFGYDKETVMVDRCIAHIIEALWAADIWTLSCCCGHNGRSSRGVIVDRGDRQRAVAVIRPLDADMQVAAWELVPGDSFDSMRF